MAFYQKGISQIIGWNLTNPITPFELNNYKYCVKYVNGFIVMYDICLPWAMECKKIECTFGKNLFELIYLVANYAKET